MAERAHPDDPAFKRHGHFRLRKRLIPWWTRVTNPYRDALEWRYRWVSRLSSGKDVLDVPCGMGWGTSLIKGAKSIRAFDLSSDAIDEARERYGKQARFEVGDMAALAVDTSTIDLVCCLEGIEHVPIPVGLQFLKEVKRVLRTGGKLCVSSPYCRAGGHSGNPHHIHEYQPKEIRKLLESHFHIEDCVARDVDILTVLYFTCAKV